MTACRAYQIENRWSAHAANDNAPTSARAKLKLRLAARRRFYSLDQISRCASITDGADSGNNRSYGYDASGKLVHVHKKAGGGQALERSDYVIAGGKAIARDVLGGTTYYTFSDHLGSPVATMNGTTGAIDRERYTPFGITLNEPSLLDDQAGFTGHIKERDKIDPVNQFLLSATGLNPCIFRSKNCTVQARYYDPVIGRLLSIDPVGFLDRGNPNFFNRYGYAFNNPTNLIDPNGESPIRRNTTMDSTGPMPSSPHSSSSTSTSSKRPTLSLPVRLNSRGKAVITDNFGARPARTSKSSRFHIGTDFRARLGDEILATQDGSVEDLTPQSTGGNVVIIRNLDGSRSGHGHTEPKTGMKVGDPVQAGDVIGVSDGSGTGTAAHQHYTYKAPGSSNFSDPMQTQLKPLESNTCQQGTSGCL